MGLMDISVQSHSLRHRRKDSESDVFCYISFRSQTLVSWATLLPKLPFATENVKNTKPPPSGGMLRSALSDGAVERSGEIEFLEKDTWY